MPKKVKLFAAGLLLAVVGIACVALFVREAHADWDRTYKAYDGNGWSMSANGVLMIENDEGWLDYLKYGITDYSISFVPEEINELVIGKDVTNFRMYNLPYELPTPDFFSQEDILGYDAKGKPYYDYPLSINLLPFRISVEAGNNTFRVIDGLLINMDKHELVMAELGVYDVVIPEGVQTIACKAFEAKRIHSVQFPSTIQTIGKCAFADCPNLKSISLPDTIKEIGESAFDYCINLSEVKLPTGLDKIKLSTFDSCAIQYVEIPSSVEEIEDLAFVRCTRLKQVVILGRVEKIGDGAFYGCSALNLIQIPEGLEFLGNGAFEQCGNLRRMILPDSLQQMGTDAFSGCSLSLLRIPERLTILIYDDREKENQVNSYAKSDKTLGLSSAETVIFSGSDYDFGYPAINGAKNVYFLGLPPADVGDILDRDTTGNIYCSEDYEFEWTRSTVSTWVRQKIQFLPADQIKEITESAINTTPEPTNTPRPIVTPRPTETPWPTPMPRPTTSPIVTAEPEQQTTDPMLLVFAGVLAAVVAGIVIVAVNRKKTNKHNRKKSG